MRPCLRPWTKRRVIQVSSSPQDALDVRRPRRRISGQSIAMLMWLFVLIAAARMIIYNHYEKEPVNLALGLVLLIAALVPLSRWISNERRSTIPLLEMHLLFYAICFGVAAFVVPERFMGGLRVREEQYTQALIAAIVAVLFTGLGYALAVRFRYNISKAFLPPAMSRRQNAFAPTILYPLAFFAGPLSRMLGISELALVFDAIRLFAFVWALHAAWSGQLPDASRRLVLWLLLPFEFMVFGGLAGGVLGGLLVYGQIVGICFALTKNRLPVAMGMAVVMTFALLQPVKMNYRDLTWNEDASSGKLEGALLFVEVAIDSYSSGRTSSSFSDVFDESYTRINHLHTTAAIMADTPSVQPFRNGSTLVPLFTKWIPRVIWKDKPREDLGNSWGRDYGYLNARDASTSYNLPWLAEMFMNYGWTGVVALSMLIGGLMGFISKVVSARVEGSVGFAFALTISSAFFFPESNISLQLGFIVVSVVAAWFSVIVVTALSKQR